mgnify:FL=1
MNNLFVISEGCLENIQEIYRLEKQIFKEEAWTLKMLQFELSNSKISRTLIIQEGSFILGYCMFRMFARECQILNFGVLPQRQQEGIASILLTKILKNLTRNSSVFLEVKKSNFPAINLYKKSGFNIFGLRNNYYKDGASALLMQYQKK